MVAIEYTILSSKVKCFSRTKKYLEWKKKFIYRRKLCTRWLNHKHIYLDIFSLGYFSLSVYPILALASPNARVMGMKMYFAHASLSEITLSYSAITYLNLSARLKWTFNSIPASLCEDARSNLLTSTSKIRDAEFSIYQQRCSITIERNTRIPFSLSQTSRFSILRLKNQYFNTQVLHVSPFQTPWKHLIP